MSKILVTPRSLTRDGHPALERLGDAGLDVVFCSPGRFPTEDELIGLLPGCVGYLAGVESITARVLEAADVLEVISRNGTGIDNIDMATAEEKGIRICRALGANARGVAELTFAHILAIVRSVTFSDATLKGEGWERRKGIELQGRTLGLIGCGKIGKLVARMALSFDMRALAFDPYPDPDFKPAAGFRYCPLADVLSQSDIISLHCQPSADGKPVINREAIAMMKDGVYLINTARSSLIDPDAALDALDSGRVAGMTLDAFEAEPPTDWRLVKHSRVIATPHIGGYTAESVDKAVSAAVDNMLEVIQ